MTADSHGHEVEFAVASDAIMAGVVSMTSHPACTEFEISDGRRVTYYPDGVNGPDVWVLEDAPRKAVSL